MKDKLTGTGFYDQSKPKPPKIPKPKKPKPMIKVVGKYEKVK